MFPGALVALVGTLAVESPAATLERQYGQWKAEAAPLAYEGTELYTFMDGGAEIYLEYGFERVESQSYRRGADEMTVDLYRMGDSGDGAYGLFTFVRPSGSEDVAVGDAAFLSGYYLAFVKGRYVGAVTAQSASAGSRDALLEVARAIASRLAGGAQPPDVLRLLPSRERLAATEKQLRGPIGLRVVSEKAADLLAGFVNGAVAGYGRDRVAGLLAWPSAALADQAWKRALERGSGACSPIGPETSAQLRCADGTKRFAAARVGGFVVFASGADQGSIDELLETLTAGVAGGGARPARER